MGPLSTLLRALIALHTVFEVATAPTGVRGALPVSVPSGIPPGPPGAMGSIYGFSSFDGPDGNPVNPADSAIVTDYQLVPGQTEAADLGLYLDLESVPNPQPIRGTGGGTDPGPSSDAFSPLCTLVTD